ncbi:hypothetical protein Tdes44962_MAKER06970 [Teratosphaeria destructans]|uniref:Uncharacterized protein n=1 Tax=Teratosphaeria destructans TaxID=418781 RepID=A0A9W7W6E2_9PEZI|nr:hypothetical protein Tdes44962_MAKER06970 [Teratosphaeria destructans]
MSSLFRDIRAKLSRSSSYNSADQLPRTPRILVDISISSPTLSKSGNPPFTITPQARVDGPRPITIDTFQRVLCHRPTALDYQGLTFENTATGELAERRVIDVHDRVPDSRSATSEEVVEIPATNASEPSTVEHTLQNPHHWPPASEPISPQTPEMRAIAEELLRAITDQTVGLDVGNTYRIGLGRCWDRISWWRPGRKAEVFAAGSVRRRAEGPRLELHLARTTTFTVVD